MKLIECVPNFSEGRDQEVINQITSEITSISTIKLLDVDPGKDTNRTVVTFVGPPEDVIEAAFLAISKASELIDMSNHKGAHPRMGATDVCPIIPIQGVSVDECISYSNKLAEKAKEKALFRTQRKAVEAGAHGTLDYTIKEGVNKNKIADEKILKSKK